MQQVVAVEVAGSGQRIDEGERRSRAVHHGDRRGAVEGDDGGRLKALQKSVEANDLGPVRILGLRRLTVQGGGGAISALTRRASRIASTQRSGLTSASPRVGR